MDTSPVRLAAGGVLALLVVVTAAPAQTRPVVDPPLFQYMAGGRKTGFPFGYPKRRVLHYQEIHDGLAGSARVIRGIGLRRSAGSTTKVPAFAATCTMRLSTARLAAAAISDSFAKNEGGDATTVMQKRKLSFAVSTPTSPLPSFAYRLPTDQPFAFAGNGPLCMDLVIPSHTNSTAFTFDLYEEGRSHIATFGKACGGTSLTTKLTTTKIIHTATGLPPKSPLLFFAGIPLNKPLDLEVIGLPGCTFLTSAAIALAGVTTSGGTHTREFDPTPARPGDAYACQVAAADPIDLIPVFTQANLVLPISPRSTGRLFAENLTASTGTPQPVFGLVLEIR